MKVKNQMRRAIGLLLVVVMLIAMPAIPLVLAAEGEFMASATPPASVPVYYQVTGTSGVYLYKDTAGITDMYRIYGGIDTDDSGTGTINPTTLGFYACDVDGVVVAGATALTQSAELMGAMFTPGTPDPGDVPFFYEDSTVVGVYTFSDSAAVTQYRVYGSFIGSAGDAFYMSTAAGDVTNAVFVSEADFEHLDVTTVPPPYTKNTGTPTTYSFKHKDETMRYRVYGKFAGSAVGFYECDASGNVTGTSPVDPNDDSNSAHNPGGGGATVETELKANKVYVSNLTLADWRTGTPEFDVDDKAGNDQNAENDIVRSFDTIEYELGYTIAHQDPADATYYARGKMYVRFVLPGITKDKADFDLAAMGWLENPVVEYVTGTNPEIIVTGYRQLSPPTGQDFSIPGSGTITASVKVLAMHNGEKIRPEFYAWMEGYDPTASGNEDYDNPGEYVGNNIPFKYTPNEVTVSAKLKMNIQISRNDYLQELKTSGISGQGFDFSTGNASAINSGAGEQFGRLMGYGISLEIANSDDTLPNPVTVGRGLKGLEFPDGSPITFTLTLTAEQQVGTSGSNYEPAKNNDNRDIVPLIWSYASNGVFHTQASSDAVTTGTKPPVNPTGRNMRWGLPSASNAGSGAVSPLPFNAVQPQNSNGSAAPAGGNWMIVPVSGQPGVYTVTVSDYSLLDNNGNYQWPLRNQGSAVETNPIYGEAVGRGLFSVGNIQVLFPQDTPIESTKNYRLTVADSGLTAASASGDTDVAPADLQVRTRDDSNQFVFTLFPAGSYSITHVYMSTANAKSGGNPYTAGVNASTSYGYGADGWMPYGSEITMYTTVNTGAGNDYERKVLSFDAFQKFDATWIQPHPYSDGTRYSSTNPTGSVFTTSIPDSSVVKAYYVAKADGTNWTGDNERNNAALVELNDPSKYLIYNTMAELSKTGGLCVGILYTVRGEAIIEAVRGYIGSNMVISSNPAAIGHVTCQTTATRMWWPGTVNKTDNETIKNFEGTKIYSEIVGAAYSATIPPIATGGDRHPTNYSRTIYGPNGEISGNTDGPANGASLLIVGVQASIVKEVEQVKSASDSSAKTHYDVAFGQREVHFVLQPEVRLPDGAPALGGGGDPIMETVTIIDTLPASLSVVGTTFYLGGTYAADPINPSNGVLTDGAAIPLKSEYDADPSAYTSKAYYEIDQDMITGVTTIKFTFEEVVVGDTMEAIHYKASIGNPGDEDKDVKNMDTIQSSVTIAADGDGRAPHLNFGNKSENVINIIKLKAAALMKSIVEQIVEIGAPITYKITHNNISAETLDDYRLLDVLPYNGDSRGTSFTGDGYTTQISIAVTGTGTITAYRINNTLDSGLNVNDSADGIASKIQVGTASDANPLTTTSIGDAKGIYLEGSIGGNSKYEMTVTITPTGNAGNDIYYNDATAATDNTSYLYAPKVSAVVVYRTLSGVAWLDEDYNGLRDAGEELLKDVAVKLVAYDNIETVIKDMQGYDCTTTTDEYGHYEFVDLPAGTYKVVFEGNGTKFIIGDYGVTTKGAANAATNSDINAFAPSDVLTAGITDGYTLPVAAEVSPYGYHVRNVDAGFVLGKITATKISSEGGGLAGAEFELTNNVTNEKRTVFSAADGKIVFEELPMGEYTLKEVAPPTDYKMSDPAFSQIFTLKQGAHIINWQEEITNTPIRTADAGIVAKKRVEGTTMTAGQFEFELRNAATGESVTAFNDANGDVKFPNLQFDIADTYNYTIKELTTSISGSGTWIFDTNVYRVSIEVAMDQAAGKLKATVRYLGTADEATPPTFVNKYTPPSDPPPGVSPTPTPTPTDTPTTTPTPTDDDDDVDPTPTPSTTPEPRPTTTPTPQTPPPPPDTPDPEPIIVFDDDGTPLGMWTWDEENEEWIFEEYVPLGALPTGDTSVTPSLVLLAAVTLIAIAMLLLPRNKRKESDS